jgi:hypothetical protein
MNFIKCNHVFSNKIKPFTCFGQSWPSLEGDQHFKGNASHVLHAYCHVRVTLGLKIIKIDFLKLIQYFN